MSVSCSFAKVPVAELRLLLAQVYPEIHSGLVTLKLYHPQVGYGQISFYFKQL